MKLKELKNTVVNVKTQKEYDELMRIYESAGWKWRVGQNPTEESYWSDHKKYTCIKIEDEFEYSSSFFYKDCGYKIISFNQFKKLQEIEVKKKSKKVVKKIKIPKCPNTLMGRHIWLKGISEPKICLACGIYDDREENEK